MAQQERAVRTRRQVLEAAADVFAERGYGASTISEIISRAGVTKGALYFHFASKEELLQSVLDEQVRDFSVPERSSKLQEWTDLGMLLAHRTFRDPLLRAGVRLSADMRLRERMVRGPWNSWIELSTGLLQQARARGELLPHVDPVETATFTLQSWIGVQLVVQVSEGHEAMEARVATLFRHVLPAISVPAVLVALDVTADRGARVAAEVESRSAHV
ncbi:ScbR family autoregulator-binding transcription factor [Streptomyces sp. HNM0574]|uniref:ScbR family autoregulator-binding transcription factor n=1 Tax=Streptomyces sp. HNM0574 TaxID=2714954 RepID=UPI00146ED738|nr:ScbR family autoregulator-binding transcription factor [Streptomyces sp. HNM0574]NLU68572.1 TetR/AcrR family transcriptional regulator [Streptomyces sp. HNM0574]